MTQYLPPNLLALFAPRDPVPYIPPLDKLPHEKKLTPYTGVGQFLLEFEDPKDTPPPTKVETKDERKERKRKERAEQVAYKLEQDLALWDPANDPQSTGDPFKSLFVGRINYDTSDSKLRREFEVYGTVKRINMVVNKTNTKPRGYAFVEYEHERDMHSAYKHADGKKIDGRRVLVDVERSRTVKGWRPRRLGGGLGGTRKGGPDVNTKYSGRDDGAGMHRDDRSRSRERGGRRDRSKSRDRGRRVDRSRSKEKERKRRSRSRERRVDRGADRGRERERFDEEVAIEEERPTKRRRRSRSKEKRRSRSRERKRSRRSRSRERRRDRSRERRGGEGDDYDMDYANVQIKQEPNGEAYDMYAGYSATAAAAPPPPPPPPAPPAGGQGDEPPQEYQDFAVKQEDGEDEKDHSQLPVPPPQNDLINFTPFPAPTNEYGTYKQEEDADN